MRNLIAAALAGTVLMSAGPAFAYKTIANTSTRIKEKLGVERTSDLIRFAVETRGGRLIDRGDL